MDFSSAISSMPPTNCSDTFVSVLLISVSNKDSSWNQDEILFFNLRYFGVLVNRFRYFRIYAGAVSNCTKNRQQTCHFPHFRWKFLKNYFLKSFSLKISNLWFKINWRWGARVRFLYSDWITHERCQIGSLNQRKHWLRALATGFLCCGF